MNNQKYASIRLTLFNGSERSFLDALDNESISHGHIERYSTLPQASGILVSITAIAAAMPWNGIANVIIAWIEALKNRAVIIQTEDGRVINIKGYSSKDVQELLKAAANVTVIDTKKEEYPSDS